MEITFKIKCRAAHEGVCGSVMAGALAAAVTSNPPGEKADRTHLARELVGTALHAGHACVFLAAGHAGKHTCKCGLRWT